MRTYDEIADRRVVITGAAGLLGGWITSAFARSGARLLLVDQDGVALEETARSARDAGAAQVEIITVDLSTSAGVKRVAATVEQLWDAADVLVNNAGVYPALPLLSSSRERVETLFELNVLCVFELTQLLAQQMVAQESKGCVVNISSGVAERPWSSGGPYAVSKAAVAMLTKVFALELGSHGVRVNAVSPGFAPGGTVSDLGPAHAQRMLDSTPLGRVSGPADAPAAVLWLCSDEASFVTGTTVTTDGGRSVGAP